MPDVEDRALFSLYHREALASAFEPLVAATGPLLEVDAKEEQSDYDMDLHGNHYAVVDDDIIPLAAFIDRGQHYDLAD